MGYVFGKISDLHVKLPSSGLYLLVKASNSAPEPFYNAHRDRSDLVSSATGVPAELDRNSRAVFGNGWYPVNHLPQVARWMTGRSWLSFRASRLSRIQPAGHDTHTRPPKVPPWSFTSNSMAIRVGGLCLFDYGWLEMAIDVPESISRTDERIQTGDYLEPHLAAFSRESKQQRRSSPLDRRLQTRD